MTRIPESEQRSDRSTSHTRLFASRRAVLGGLAGSATTFSGCFGLLPNAGSTTPTPPDADTKSWPSVGFDAANTGHDPAGRGPEGPTERWRFYLGSAAQAPPVVGWTMTGYRVAVWGNPSTLHFLDVASGEQVDSYEPGQGNSISRPIGAPVAPAFDGGILYLGGGGIPSAPYVYAYRTGTGEVRWQFRTGDQTAHSPVTIADGTMYVGTASSSPALYAADVDTYSEVTGYAERRWKRELDGMVVGASAAADGQVFVGTSAGTVHAFDADPGTERWNERVDGKIVAAPAVSDGTIAIASTDGNVRALDTERGDERWSTTTGGPVRTSPGIAGDTVVVGSDDGNVYALAVSTGEERWSVSLGDVVRSSPAIVDGTVYVGCDDGSLYALSLEDGSEEWRFETDGAIVEAPAVADGVAYACSRDGYLYAVGGDASVD